MDFTQFRVESESEHFIELMVDGLAISESASQGFEGFLTAGLRIVHFNVRLIPKLLIGKDVQTNIVCEKLESFDRSIFK